MNTKRIIPIITTAALAMWLAGCETEKNESDAKLAAQAKVSKADAEKIALGKVSGGTVKEGEIEEEHGRLIWSFDITTPGTKDITEVAVDAKTGEVVSVDKESPEQEGKEKEEDKKTTK